MKVRFTRRAAQDLSEIAAYIQARNPLAARKVRAAILDGIGTISRFPWIGRRQNVEGVRKHVTRRYPYLVYYTVDEIADEIVVLSIRHPAREREFSDV